MLHTYSFVHFPSWGNKKTVSPLFYEFCHTEGLLVLYYGNKLCLYSMTNDQAVRFSLLFTISFLAYNTPAIYLLQFAISDPVSLSRLVAIDPKATRVVYKLQVIYRPCID